PQARPFVVANDPIQRLAFEQLHDHEDIAAVTVEVIHRYDVGVREMLGLATLALERLQRLRVTAELVIQQLQGHPGIAVLGFFLAEGPRLEDDPHATAPEFLFEPEPVFDNAPGSQRRTVSHGALEVTPGRIGGTRASGHARIGRAPRTVGPATGSRGGS